MQTRLLCYFILFAALLALAAPAVVAVSAADQAYMTGKQLYVTTHYEEAIPELKRFITGFPDDPRISDATFMLGRSYQSLQQWDEAITAFTQVTTRATAAELVKLRAEAYFQLAESQVQVHHFEEAAQAYRACLKIAGDDDLATQAEYWLGDCLNRLGRDKEALVEYGKVAQNAPKHELAPWALYMVGVLQLRQSHYAEAIAALGTVTAKYPDAEVCGEATRLLGVAYANRAREDKDPTVRDADNAHALQLLTAVQGYTGLGADSRRLATLAMAQIYTDQQNYAKAAALYAKALGDLDPAGQQALDIRQQRAIMFYDAQQYGDAAADYAFIAQGNASEESRTLALYWQGNCAYQQGLKTKDKTAYTQAVDAFRRFLATVPATQAQALRATLLLALCQEDLASLGDDAARTEAVNTFKTVLEKWPASREAEEARAGIARLTTNMTVAELSEVAGLLPDGAAAWSVSLRLAREEFLDGKYPDAIAAAQKVLDGKPTPDITASAAYLIAASQHRLNHAEAAIPYYKQALANTTASNLTLYAQRGLTKALLDTRQFSEASAAARALLRLPVQAKEGPEHEQEMAERYALLAQAAAGAGQYAEAGAAYTHEIKECPSSPLIPYALMGLGWIADNQKDSAAAMAAYRQLVEKYPDHQLAADAYFRLGNLLNDKKEYQQAIDMLRKVPPGYQFADQAAYAIAWAYRDLDKQSEANAAFTQMAEQFPKSPLAGDSLYRVGEYWLEVKNDAEALSAFNRAMELLPMESKLRPTVAYRLGVTAFNLKNYTLAVTTFDRNLVDFPDGEFTGESLFWKGQSLELQGEEHAADAREAYRQYLAKYPGGPLVLDAALGAGRAALAAKQYAPALADLHKALELCNTLGQKGELVARATDVQPEAQFTLGECYFAQGQYPNALKNYAGVAAYNMEPWYSRSMLQSARCSALTHDNAAALATLRLLLKSFPASDAAKEAPKVAAEYGLVIN